jgi:hypothetical protein
MIIKMNKSIEERWQWWRPLATVWARKCAHPDIALDGMRRTHLFRIDRLLSKGIRWPVIRKDGLDDPRITEFEFVEKLAAAVEHRRRGISTVKGKAT